MPDGWAGRLAEIGIATTSPEALATGKIQTFGKAVEGYIEAVKITHPTLWGTGKIRLIQFVAERISDFVLKELDMGKIESILRLLAFRPVSEKTGEPVSVSWTKNAIKEFRQFLRWLHKSKSYGWRRPDDYEVLPVRVGRTQDERARITSLAVETFSVDELIVLWRYALPWERLLMSLALNCGFGMAEIATLRRRRSAFRKAPPLRRTDRVVSCRCTLQLDHATSRQGRGLRRMEVMGLDGCSIAMDHAPASFILSESLCQRWRRTSR